MDPKKENAVNLLRSDEILINIQMLKNFAKDGEGEMTEKL